MRTMKIIFACLICTMIMGFLLPVGKVAAASNEVKKDASLGGWELVTDNTPSMMKEEDSARINTALKDIGGNFDVLDLVATQVVSGTNYKALCIGNDKNLYVVTWYRNLQGNVSLTSAECVDIGAYLTL